MVKRVLITGGTGFIGSALARRLIANDVTPVRLLGRDFSRSGALPTSGVEAVSADLRDAPKVLEACRNVDTVFHIGALSSPWAAGGKREFYDVNVTGTDNVLEGCRKMGVRRMVYVSSPSVVFDGQDHQNLTEDAPYPKRFASAYSWSKKIGEDRVNAAAQAGLETIILRPKAVFGPGDTSLLPRLLTAAAAGRLPQIGNGGNKVDLTYVDNVIEALCLSQAASERALGRTYTITGGESAALWGVIGHLLRSVGLSDRLRRIPVRAALVAAGLMEARAALLRREPLLTRYSALILARTQTYDISAARELLGYKPVVTLADGIERTIASLRQTR
ncbi:MAG: NAD-dependent epimerase/dehydratase family protein [Armatimonadota bacterium]